VSVVSAHFRSLYYLISAKLYKQPPDDISYCHLANVADAVAYYSATTGWRRGVVVSGVRRINEVNARRARLVLGWVTVCGRVLGM